ncbi:hypothetical protein EJB05_03475, partial [Eragrostis curvula]
MVGVTASALIGVLHPLLSKLYTLLGGEYGRLKGVRREISFLHDELRSMNTALEVASHLEEPSTQMKEWMHQVRELSYDVEDCIDYFMHYLGENENCDGIIRKTSRRLKTLRVLHRIASQIVELKERAMQVSDRQRRYEIEAVVADSSSSTIDPRLPALFEEANRLVGIDVPRNELVEWLIGDTDLVKQLYRVASIVGFGGLGKTTLAIQVYQSIKSQYDCTAFVSVSRNPNISKILTDLLWQVLDTSNPRSKYQKQRIKGIREDLEFKILQEYHHLVRIIREYLQDKRYFIIIDDIWSKQAWEFIQYRERLIWRWIAKGFINKQQGQSLEETGERCFNELMNRNMIQPVDIDYSGAPRACRVHDIMLDLIINISTEENFVTLVSDTNFSTSPRTIRRISLQGKCEDITWPDTSSLTHVRSLSVYDTFNHMPPLQDLQFLRALDLQDWHDMEDDCAYMENVGVLHQLRYLSLGRSNINEIPKQIGKLKNLQTLDLRTCTKLKELPATVTELRQLVRLFVWSGVKFPQGISKMKSLEELSKFDGSSNSADVVLELGELTRLRRLRVGWHPNGPVTDEEQAFPGLCSRRNFFII